MKKIYLLAFSFIGMSQINAQLTLTKAANDPVIGDTYDMKTLDTNSTQLPMNISGANVAWNITNVTESGGLTTNTFIDPATDPNASSFPGTTIIQTDGNSNTYFKSSGNLVELLGLDGGMFVLNYNTNAATIANYPISIGYSNNDTGAGAITANTLTGTFTSTINTIADGSGTLNFNGLPSANYTNCLRVKTTQKISFIVGGFISGTIDMVLYNYYVSAYKSPVFTVNYTTINAPLAGINNMKQDQVSAISNVALGIGDKKLNDITFKAYPNPASSEVFVHFVLTQKESYTIDIVNTFGQVVKSVAKPDLQPGLYNESIDINGLSAGVYHIQVKGKNSTGVEKLIIQ